MPLIAKSLIENFRVNISSNQRILFLLADLPASWLKIMCIKHNLSTRNVMKHNLQFIIYISFLPAFYMTDLALKSMELGLGSCSIMRWMISQYQEK